MEGHSSKLEQAKDRISELQYEMEVKGKIEEQLVKISRLRKEYAITH
jgi:hypothetical protein